MFPDYLCKTGLTTDYKKIQPGMIYVDLPKRDSIKEIYCAYQKGASLIFTTKNITDPDLPVIKVKSIHEKYWALLNEFFYVPQNAINLIAIGGGSGKNTTYDLISALLFDRNRINEEETNSLNREYRRNFAFEEFYNYLFYLYKNGNSTIPVSIELNDSFMSNINHYHFDCGIFTDLPLSNYENILKLYRDISPEHPIIVNADDNEVLKVFVKDANRILLTYGLNSNSTITASSIDFDEVSSFNYCIQRTMITRRGKIIEPFEVPIRMKIMGNRYIYSALAAITCALFYDIDIESISKRLFNYYGSNRRFEKIYNGEVTIIDNYCSIPADYTAAFESLAMLNYNSLYIILALEDKKEIAIQMECLEVVHEWVRLLNCRGIMLVSGSDNENEDNPVTIKLLRTCKRILARDDFELRYYKTVLKCFTHFREISVKGDILLLLGGASLQNAKQTILSILKKLN